MTIEAKVIAHSVWHRKKPRSELLPIMTMQLRYPRFIHAEFMTHRDFSRNASSSRAVPVDKMIAQIEADPALPAEWGKHKPGMQSAGAVEIAKQMEAERIWREIMHSTIFQIGRLKELELHKQVVNRLLEPFAHISVVVTSTQWQNFFALRCSDLADPTMRALAEAMREAHDASVPTMLHGDQWHAPYTGGHTPAAALQSAACCARVSYLRHDGTPPTPEENEALAARLLADRHMSPFEHQARPARGRFYNLHDWRSFRFDIENPDRVYRNPAWKYTPKEINWSNPESMVSDSEQAKD